MNRYIPTLLAGGLAFAGIASQSEAAGLLIADGGLGGQLEIKEHDVKVTVNNGVVVTTVNQIFHNTEKRNVEALYTFPVPRGASISNFSMWINGKEMIGEVVEKQKAREIYNSYKTARPKDPGLLEQVDYRTFEMRVFPIGPDADQRVQVTYYQELDFDANEATYVYPLATSTRPGVNTRTTGKFALSLDVKSEIPIKKVESASHPSDFAIAAHSPKYQQASLETRGGDLSRDVVLTFDIERPRTGVDLIASKPANEDGYFSLTLTAGEELAAVNKPMDYVFVLDVSGSMGDDQKLALSEQSLQAFIDALAPEDRFEVMAFNVQPTTLFNAITPADDAAKQRAAAFLRSQEAKGGTSLSPALNTAYRYADGTRALNVIVLSDGMSEQRDRTELATLIKQRPADTRVFAIGIGNDVNRGLLEQMAQESGGLAAFLSRDDNTQRQAQAFRRKLLRPVATDVAIKLDGVDAYDLVPAQLPNLYYGMPVRVYGRYKGAGSANVTVSGSVMGKPIAQTVQMDLPKNEDTNPEIERMWALKQVDALLKQADASGSRQGVIPEIIRLGEGYSIVTEYTSFLVLENDGEYQRWKIDRKNALRTERDRAAQQRVSDQLQQLRDDAANNLGPAGLEKIAMNAPVKQIAPSAATPSPTPATASPQQQSQPQQSTSRESSRSRDLTFGGGGAFDPIAALFAICFGGAVLLIARLSKPKA